MVVEVVSTLKRISEIKRCSFAIVCSRCRSRYSPFWDSRWRTQVTITLIILLEHVKSAEGPKDT